MATILVVEDESIIADDIQATLRALGHVVPTPVASADEALEAAERVRPDLVLMDVRIRGARDGIETAALLKERSDVPVVYLTSYSDDGTLERAKTTAPHGFLLKPFEDRDLKSAVEIALHKHAFERRIAVTERMASLGTMAAGIGHEINNPLSWVSANVEWAVGVLDGLVDEGPPVLAELREALAEAKEGAARIAKVVDGLRHFSRATAPRRGPLDLADVVALALQVTTNRIRHAARVQVENGGPPEIEGDAGQLVQVLVTLLLNAADAIGDGDAEHHSIRIVIGTSPEGAALLEVHDTGPGIPRAIQNRVFDPFFTTKAVGVGTGLGLSVAHAFVTGHGGEVTFTSEPGRTVFRVTLPSGTREEDPKKSESTTRRGRVLVIDDEPSVGTCIRRVLRQGHDVTIETDGHAAIARVVTGERFDAIFCDVMMPKISGLEVYEAIEHADLAQAARVIFLTAGTFGKETAARVAGTGRKTIDKPFANAAIRAAVDELG